MTGFQRTPPANDGEISRRLYAMGYHGATFHGPTGPAKICQEHSEFCRTIRALLETGIQFQHYLEIGAAGGGTAKALWSMLPSISQVTLVDLGQHPVQDLRYQPGGILDRHASQMGAELFIGSSHSEECGQFLAERGPFDLIMVDGDHTFEGVKQDALMVADVAAPGAVVMFHDAVSGKQVPRFVDQELPKLLPHWRRQPTIRAVYQPLGLVWYRLPQ